MFDLVNNKQATEYKLSRQK